MMSWFIKDVLKKKLCSCCRVHPAIREESTGKALCKAARKGDYVHLHREKRDYDCDLNAIDHEGDGSSPLLCASKFGHLQLVNWIVHYHIDPNVVDTNNRTALIWSLVNGHYAVSRALLRHFREGQEEEEEKNEQEEQEEEKDKNETKKEDINQTVRKKIDVDVQDKDGLTALHILCMKHDITKEEKQIIDMILGVSKDINSVEIASGSTCLHFACRYGHEEVVEALMKKRASVSVVDKSGRCALHWACRANNLKIVQHLCEQANTADLNFKTKEGMTPMILASTYGTIELTRHLAMKGARPPQKFRGLNDDDLD